MRQLSESISMMPGTQLAGTVDNQVEAIATLKQRHSHRFHKSRSRRISPSGLLQQIGDGTEENLIAT